MAARSGRAISKGPADVSCSLLPAAELPSRAIITSFSHQLPPWAAAVDFKKAFDCVDHKHLWDALRQQHIPEAYITLLQHMYNDQTATVRTDTSSRSFSIQRGVKQGDPLSSFLFNALLEHIFRQIKPGWQRKKFGIKLGFAQETSITNLRFADDVLLCAPNLRRLT